MRRFFKSIACLVMSLLLSVTFLGGCNLITVDNVRDMNQVVATIKISDQVPETEKIYKKDIVMAYMNYGYYQEYQGTPRSEVIKNIVNSLISNRVYVQNAILEFNTTDTESIYYGNIVDSSKEAWDIDRYLTNGTVDAEENEILDAEYSALKDMNDFIDNYLEDKEEEANDTVSDTIRAVPTGAKKEEKELTSAQKQAYLTKGLDKNSSSERRKAYNRVIEVLEANELLGKNYNGELTSTTYYEQTLKTYKEALLLEKFEKCITTYAKSQLSFEILEQEYVNKYEEQSKMTASEFATKLSSATAGDPILVCNQENTYGYVYNLLLGASTEMTDALTKWNGENPNATTGEQIAKRNEIFKDITVKDLRSTWLTSGYDFDMETMCFTGDYTFVKNGNSLPFQGIVKHLNASEKDNDDYSARYGVPYVEEFTLDEFIEMMEIYLYGAPQPKVASDNKSVYKKVEANNVVDDYEEKINDLLFAFSTDDGSLNTYKGYSSEPKADASAGRTEKYVKEFAAAAREILGIKEKDGPVVSPMGNNSYIMVATDFGYHIMFYSQVFDKNYDYPELEDYLDAFSQKTKTTWEEELGEILKGWDDWKDTNSYLYQIASGWVNALVNKEYGKIVNDLQDQHVYGKNGTVVKYEDRYADLLEA